MGVYINPIIKEIINYYGDTLYSYDDGLTIHSRITKLSELLWDAFLSDNAVILNEINNYHPSYIGKSWKQIKAIGFSKKNAFDTIALQYGYEEYDNVSFKPIDTVFEKAVDTTLRGDMLQLRKLLKSYPDLVQRRSLYNHEATLLHYLGNNGVELYRQVIPLNVIEILKLLIDSGASVDATMKVYGGNYTMIDLINTSTHPKDAGLIEAINRAYQEIITG